jgi:hypothetical protein
MSKSHKKYKSFLLFVLLAKVNTRKNARKNISIIAGAEENGAFLDMQLKKKREPQGADGSGGVRTVVPPLAG